MAQRPKADRLVEKIGGCYASPPKDASLPTTFSGVKTAPKTYSETCREKFLRDTFRGNHETVAKLWWASPTIETRRFQAFKFVASLRELLD